MARFFGALAVVGAVFGGSVALAAVEAPTAVAQPCGGAVVLGFGGSQCDGPYYPDGSFQRCVSTYVFGIGGWNCFIVPAPRPA